MADMTDGERIAEERIEEAARTGQDWLDLGDLDLISLPYGIQELQSLRRLSIGGVFTVTPTGFRPRDGKLSTRKISDIDAISGLKNLQVLHLGFSRIADLRPIAKLGLLEHLDFAATAVKDLAPISNLVSLKTLIFWHTDITDLTPISGIHRLHELDFSYTKISDLSPIARLQELTHLSFNNTQVSDLAPIALLQQLQVLRCSETKIHDLSPISDLQQLRELTCEGTLVSDLSPMIGSERLESLDCSRTRVTNLSAISGLQQLRHLDFSNTQVSDLTQITGVKNLTTLVARNCLVSSLPREINRLQRLQLFDLINNNLKTLPRELAELTKIEAASRHLSSDAVSSGLFLDGNPLEAPIPELIAPGQPQATINVFRWLRGEPIEVNAKEPDPPAPAEGADDPPAIPEQGTGPRVVLDQTGRLVFAKPSDLDAKGNDRNRLEALHPALREAAAELTKALQGHPSNLRNERLLQKAEAYRALVDLALDEVNFARLYGAGMQLLNAAAVTRRALEAGRVEVPELTPVQDECLANIENLHPPFVLASRDGQEMLADQTTIKLTAEAVEGIKEAGTELGTELINHPDLADREVGENIRDAAAEIEPGDNNTRDAVNAVSTMRNAIIVVATASKWAIVPSMIGFAFSGPAGAVAAGGATLGWYLAKVAEKTKSFRTDTDNAANAWNSEADKMRNIRRRAEEHKKLLLKVEPKLRKITHLPDFTWLESSLDWLKRKSPPDKKE